jgi:hypothetical protein
MPRLSSKLVVYSALVALWLGLLFYYFGLKSRYSGIEDWPSSSATITERINQTITKRRDSDYNGTQIYNEEIGSVSFTYIVDGAEYTANKATPNQAHLPVDYQSDHPRAFYNPKNPNIAVLVREPFDDSIYLNGLVAIPVFLAGFILIRRNLDSHA